MPKNINYTNRDFDTIKTDLLAFIKSTFPDYGNFSENSSAMMLIEALAYGLDSNHFYLDEKYKELFLDSATELKNIIQISKLLGYKYRGKTRSVVNLDLFITVPYIDNNGVIEPDTRLYMNIKSGSVFKSTTSPVQYFEIIEDCDFNDYDEIQIAERVDPFDPDSAPLTYALRKKVKAVNGRRKTESFTVTDYTPFLELTLSEPNVLDIVSVTDGSGNPYYEVNYLAQDRIFTITANSVTGDELNQVPYILQLQTVTRRFIKEVDQNNITKIVFGAGSASISDDSLTPSPYPLVLSSTSYAGNVIDPNNFLSTSTLGISPANTTITVTYRYGGGVESNVPAELITSIDEITYTWPTNDSLTSKSIVYQSIGVINREAAQGGKDETSLEELRHHASSYFSTQMRAVTLQDYITLIYTMPSSYGSVYRIYGESSTGLDTSLNFYVLSQNSDGQLVPPYESLMDNIKIFLTPYRMLNDTLYIQTGNIINIGINFEIVINESYNGNSVLFECIKQLKEKYHISNMDFNKPIIYSEIYELLQKIPGIISIAKIEILNLNGTINGKTYSNYKYNIKTNTKNGIVFSESKSIFEIKYPDNDINGRIISK